MCGLLSCGVLKQVQDDFRFTTCHGEVRSNRELYSADLLACDCFVPYNDIVDLLSQHNKPFFHKPVQINIDLPIAHAKNAFCFPKFGVDGVFGFSAAVKNIQ
jgi:hypothetical protein